MSQIFGNGLFPNDGLNGTAAPWLAPGSATARTFPAGSPGGTAWGPAADGVRPAWFGGTVLDAAAASLPGGAFGAYGSGGTNSILAALATMVQQYIGRLGATLFGTQSTARSTGAATFQNVSLGSVGDPHLGISGTALHADGTTAAVDSHFDSMSAHADLFSTRDFGDGFTVSTNVTQPAANGVTQNASATASMDGGLDNVTMTAAGAVSVTSGGMAIALAPNQSVQLANGATVAEAANGSVSISEAAFGTTLTTTFAQNGTGGVDVTATGSNVTLAGDLITGGTTPAAQTAANVRRPVTAVR
jgi:hypothetical protein